MQKQYLLKLLIPILTVSFLFGCAGQMSYAPTSSYSEGDSRDINDEDILKAFQAEPQINLPVKIAWYNMSSDSLLYYIKTTNNNNISENYVIPKTLIEGLEPLYGKPYYSSYFSPKPINFKEIRLLAARAKCDIVILVTSRFEEKRELNGWGFLNVLILPALFTPYWHIEYKYSSELFVFDVRNGYMYRHLEYGDEKRSKYINIWDAENAAVKTNSEMLNSARTYMIDEINKLFTENTLKADKNAGAKE